MSCRQCTADNRIFFTTKCEIQLNSEIVDANIKAMDFKSNVHEKFLLCFSVIIEIEEHFGNRFIYNSYEFVEDEFVKHCWYDILR